MPSRIHTSMIRIIIMDDATAPKAIYPLVALLMKRSIAIKPTSGSSSRTNRLKLRERTPSAKIATRYNPAQMIKSPLVDIMVI